MSSEFNWIVQSFHDMLVRNSVKHNCPIIYGTDAKSVQNGWWNVLRRRAAAALFSTGCCCISTFCWKLKTLILWYEFCMCWLHMKTEVRAAQCVSVLVYRLSSTAAIRLDFIQCFIDLQEPLINLNFHQVTYEKIKSSIFQRVSLTLE